MSGCKLCPATWVNGASGMCGECLFLHQYIKPRNAHVAVRLACERSGVDFAQVAHLFPVPKEPVFCPTSSQV